MSTMTMRLLTFVIGYLLYSPSSDAAAFVPPSGPAPVGGRIGFSTSIAPLSARKPTFNKKTQKWERASDDDGKYPYDAVGSLLRHGPSPFITRVTDPDLFEQMVLKYMATEGVTRAEATGNMDAKLNNGADWMYQKMEEKKGAPKVDYTRLDKKDAALTVIWALGITPLAVSVDLQTFGQLGAGVDAQQAYMMSH